MSSIFESFVAGILHHYPALVHFLSPSRNSLRRLIPGYFAGAYCVWGIDNKETPIRIVAPSIPTNVVTNVEIKTLDHTANVFHALASVIKCGISGMRNNMKLPKPVPSDNSELTPSIA